MKGSRGSSMEIEKTELPGVLLLKPRRFVDGRGYFVEVFSERTFSNAGVKTGFVQENQSYSIKAGTIRGLHFQVPPAPQAKLVRVLRGAIFDVAADLRQGSPTYGQWISKILTAEHGEQLFIPRGFAHGFCTMEPDSEVLYNVDGFYAPECDSGLNWSDPDLKINWPIDAKAAILSDKDAKLGFFKDFVSPFHFGEGVD
jgi:dTDP-4-dehydrorhamnose 3,5-epimerase